MSAQGSQSGINIKEEVVWGEVDTGQFAGTNFTSEDMAFAIKNQVSNNIRPDRQIAELVQVGAETSGGFETEFQVLNLDNILPGFLWDDDWNNPPAGETVVFTIESGGGIGGLMAVADSSLYHLGQVIGIAGTISNNGVFTVKALPDGTTVQFIEPMVTETSVAATFTGHYLINGVYKHSYSIERANNDISQFFLYRGMVGNTLEMSIESGSPIMAKVSFVGKDEQLQQVQWGTSDPTDPSTKSIMNAVSSVGDILVDNLAMDQCLLQKIDFTLDNQVEGKTGVGVLGFCNAEGKSISLTGNISMYFNDKTYYEKYLESTPFSIQIPMTDNDGNKYVVQLPQCKFDDVKANVSGKDDDVMVEGTFVAILSPTLGYTIQITRILV